jgi:hypothetical protein
MSVPSSHVRTACLSRLWFVPLSPSCRWSDVHADLDFPTDGFHLACRCGPDVCYACSVIAWWFDPLTRNHCNAATSSSSSGCDPSDQKPAHDVRLCLSRLSRNHHVDVFQCFLTFGGDRIRGPVICSSNVHDSFTAQPSPSHPPTSSPYSLQAQPPLHSQ